MPAADVVRACRLEGGEGGNRCAPRFVTSIACAHALSAKAMFRGQSEQEQQAGVVVAEMTVRAGGASAGPLGYEWVQRWSERR